MAETDLSGRPEEQVATGLGADIGEATIGEAEPWELWETKLVLWSLLIGVGALIVLGILINMFLLP